MKNLPENDIWKKVGDRLDAYTEVPPDGLWDRIAGGSIPSGRSSTVAVWVDRFTVLSLLIYISFMAGYTAGTTMQPETAFAIASPEFSGKLLAPGDSLLKHPPDKSKTDERVHAGDGFNVSAQPASKKITPVRPQYNEQAFKNNSAFDQHSAHVDPRHTETFSESTIPVGQVLSMDVNARSEGSQASGGATPDSITVVEKMFAADSAVVVKNNEDEASKKKKLRKGTQLYFTVSPALSFQKITPGHRDKVNVQGLRSPGILSAERFGLALEIGFQRPLAKRLEGYGGISYYQQRQQLTYLYDSPDQVDIASSAEGQYTIKPQTIARSFHYNMLNAGIAAGLLYHIKGVKLMHKIGAGLQYQRGFRRSASESTYDNAGSAYLNYQLSYRVEYIFSRRLNIFIQPAFTHAVYSKEKLSAPFTIKPYRASMGFGAVYRF
ncbi:MAG TPA: hypothetical protein VD816_07705 [Ohtaekwangia sp.]|nr:hypothetical protein [Ohtaekwangia sp.]